MEFDRLDDHCGRIDIHCRSIPVRQIDKSKEPPGAHCLLGSVNFPVVGLCGEFVRCTAAVGHGSRFRRIVPVADNCMGLLGRQEQEKHFNRRNSGMMEYRNDHTVKRRAINFEEKFGKFSDYWAPKIIAQLNDYHIKLVRVKGDFVWHDHKETDEVFIVIEGELRIDFRDGAVALKPGEMFVVPKGVEHKPFSEKECKLLLVEPSGTVNTGDAGGDRTAENDIWI